MKKIDNVVLWMYVKCDDDWVSMEKEYEPFPVAVGMRFNFGLRDLAKIETVAVDCFRDRTTAYLADVEFKGLDGLKSFVEEAYEHGWEFQDGTIKPE